MTSEHHNPFTAPVLSPEAIVLPKKQTGLQGFRRLFEGSVADARLFPAGTFRTALRLYLISLAVWITANAFQTVVFCLMGFQWGAFGLSMSVTGYLISTSTIATLLSAVLMAMAAPRCNWLAVIITVLLLPHSFSRDLYFHSPNLKWMLVRIAVEGAIQLSANLMFLWFFVRLTKTPASRGGAIMAAVGLVVIWLLGIAAFYAQVIQWPDFFSRHQNWVLFTALAFTPFWIAVGVLQILVTRDALAAQIAEQPSSVLEEQDALDSHLQHGDTL